MRIISGKFKGKTIHAPKNLPVRPTTDFAKESLFNVINNNFNFETLKVLDLFCGTGNITYEFVSRGSTNVLCVDVNYNCCAFVKKTISEMQVNTVRVARTDVFSFLKNCTEKFDFIFADPPYEMDGIERIPALVFEKQLLNSNGWLVVEHSIRTILPEDHLTQKRDYGKVNFSIFE